MAAILGGLVYLALVFLIGTPISTAQGAEQAFSLKRDVGPLLLFSIVSQGSRGFFLWPEHYFPGYLKQIQLLLVAGAAIACLWLPKTPGSKIGALALLALAAVAPRSLQLLHPGGTFHNLTLTAYAIVIAGSLMIILRGAPGALRNAAGVVALAVISGYVLHCNWISTVNHQNTTAHFAQTTQILARIRALPAQQWDGNSIAVAGSLPLFGEYPFRKATGVATDFIDATHLQRLARLLRDNVKVLPIDEATPKAREAAAALPAWPDPGSVAIIDGMAIIVLGKPRRSVEPQQ
jgi:hypothetical protein